MKKQLCLLCCLLSFSAFADDFAFPTIEKFNVAAWYGYSPSTGSTQIPLGGVPGTSSPSRPTQNEVGIDSVSNYNLSAAFRLGGVGIYGMYRNNRQSGNQVLTQNLITHGVEFPAGTVVVSGNKLDLYRLGANLPWQISPLLAIYPIMEFTTLNFGYDITSKLNRTSRAFTAGTLRLGAGAQYELMPRLNFDIDFESSLGSFTHLNVQTGSTHLGYTFYQDERFASIIFGGVAYTNIYFKDNQSMPNLIQIRQFPEVQIGVRVAML